MTVQELECFRDIAETLSFTITSERLHISQPVVSRHIQMLEDDLGFKLIDRSIRRKISLTSAGRALQECLDSCSDLWLDAMKKIRTEQHTSLISFYVLNDQILPDNICSQLNEFRLTYSQNTPVYRSIPANGCQEAMRSGGFLIFPDYVTVPGNIDQVKISMDEEQHLQLICSKKHACAGKHLADFAGSPLFLMSDLPSETIKYLQATFETLTGVKSELKLLDEPNALFMYLVSGNTAVTINTPWYAWIHDPRIMAVNMPRPLSFYIGWDQGINHAPQGMNIVKKLGVIL